jgi:hypothetical protein
LSITFVGFLANFLIPVRVGEFIRAFLMEKREQVKFFEAFSSVVVERLLDLLAIVILGIIGLFLLPPEVEYPSWAINSFRIVGILILIGLIVIIVGTRKEEKLMKAVDSILCKIPVPKKWRSKLYDWIEATIRGAKGISYSPIMGMSLFVQSLILWLLSILPVYFLFQAFLIELPFPVLLSGVMLFNLSFILPAPPGYVGSYEVLWSAIFVGLGLSLSDIVPVSIMAHLLRSIFIALTGGLAITWLGLPLRELRMPSKTS